MKTAHGKLSTKERLTRLLLCLFWVFPVKQNKILFQSYYGNKYNDNPMMISKELEADPRFKVIWATEKDVQFPWHIQTVNVSSIKYLYELATSKVWVDNCRKRIWVKKRKSQYYIQTWHGNLGNKRVEGAAVETLDERYISRAKNDASMTDLMISGSVFFNDLIRKYFWYDGEVLMCGTPRLDMLFSTSEEKKEKVKEEIGVPVSKKVVLYAPTFRQDFRTDCYDLNYDLLLHALKQRTGDDWIALVRFHPNVSTVVSLDSDNENILNVTAYPDLYNLFTITDLVISDYSSLAFEAPLFQIPVFLFALDADQYTSERGFYWNLKELPFLLCKSNEELRKSIESFDREKYDQRVTDFYSNLGIAESGNASQIVADRIREVAAGVFDNRQKR